MSRVEVVTFGCRLNTFESAVIRGLAESAGPADMVIVNTCAVTAEAERQARQAVRRARRERPDATIVVTGCAAQVNAAAFAAMPEVDRVLGNAEKLEAASFAAAAAPVLVADAAAMRDTAEHLIEGLEGRSRAIVQVQQGCDHRCTFCIIPYGRGPSRSVPMGRVAEQVRALVERGYNEVVLTGVDLTAYGPDLPGAPTLGQMVRRVLAAVPGLRRLRLSSLDPVEVDDELMALIGDEPRLMPHLHLSLQAGDDMILKRMKRRHSRADAVRFCDAVRARRPDAVFGADLIAGFPTETEAMFENSLALVEDCRLTYLHVFPYSARPGTPAARMPALPGPVVRERARRLREAGDAALAQYLGSCVGSEVEVLVERERTARTTHYAPVDLDRDAEPGSLIRVRVTGVAGLRLVGTLSREAGEGREGALFAAVPLSPNEQETRAPSLPSPARTGEGTANAVVV